MACMTNSALSLSLNLGKDKFREQLVKKTGVTRRTPETQFLKDLSIFSLTCYQVSNVCHPFLQEETPVFLKSDCSFFKERLNIYEAARITDSEEIVLISLTLRERCDRVESIRVVKIREFEG